MRINTSKTLISMIIAVVLFAHFAMAQQLIKLMPDDIVNLCASGKSNEELIDVIQNRGLAFEVNLPVMQRLIDAGVPPEILQVILSVSSHGPDRLDYNFRQNLPAVKSGLSLSTSPHGMTVYIDGIKLGVTPFFSNKLEHGEHHVRVEHPMFFPREVTIEIDGRKLHDFNWEMEPREPIIHLKLSVEGEEEMPWSWIVRPRETCSVIPTLKLEAFQFHHSSDEAYFKLDEESKKVFRGGGNACLEVFLWRGEVRRDMSIRDLPPCTARYYITDIRINKISYIELNLKVSVRKIDPLHPTVALESDTGNLVETADKVPEAAPYELKDRLLEDLDLILQ